MTGKLFVLSLIAVGFAQEPSGILGKLRLTNVDDPAKVTVVLINASGPDCRQSVPLEGATPIEGAAEVQVSPHVQPSCWQDKASAGLVVMAPGRAVAYLHGAFLNLGVNQHQIEMRPPREVVIDVWPAGKEFERAARDDIANFDWILEKRLAGVRLRPRFHDPKELVSNLTCENAANSATYTKGVINLYYGGGRRNLSCRDNSAVFVHDIPVLGDVAHEVGHKLGLNQPDSERVYAAGHTTNAANFTCANVMWTASEILKDELSIGQAAWLGLSCSSYVADQGGCLLCAARSSGKPEPTSPCPRFSLGQSPPPAACPFDCPLEAAKHILENRPEMFAPNHDDKARLCTRGALRARLIQRFRDLRRHVQSRPDLRLSTNDEKSFVKWWMSRTATILTIEAIWATRKLSPATGKAVPAESDLSYLKDQFQHGPLKNHLYLMYARDRMNQGTYQARCESGPGDNGK